MLPRASEGVAIGQEWVKVMGLFLNVVTWPKIDCTKIIKHINFMACELCQWNY